MTDTTKPARVPMPEWTDEELRTLVDFRRRNGRRWKSKLLDLYLFGKDDREPNGPALRWIRNRQGPSRVHALSKATLDDAEARLPQNVSHSHEALSPDDRPPRPLCRHAG